MIISLFTSFQIIWNPRKSSVFPDLMSRNVFLKDVNGHQLSHKKLQGHHIFQPKRTTSSISHQLQQLCWWWKWQFLSHCLHTPVWNKANLPQKRLYWYELFNFSLEVTETFFIVNVSEEARTKTKDANGKLCHCLRKHKFMETIILKLKPIVNKVTMRYPMRTSIWSINCKLAKKQKNKQ